MLLLVQEFPQGYIIIIIIMGLQRIQYDVMYSNLQCFNFFAQMREASHQYLPGTLKRKKGLGLF